MHVAYFQALSPPSLSRRLSGFDAVLFMTDRAVPFSVERPYAIDFIDDLGGAAARRAASYGFFASAFWRWEARRLRRFDAKLAYNAALSVAVNERDAAAISPCVETIPLAIGTKLMPDDGTKVLFSGNLFYSPNAEAARWICSSLVPKLVASGFDPSDMVIAGRRPPAALCAQAASVGVDLRPDLPDLAGVLREAAIVVAPVVSGSGVQYKVLDAVGAGRPCVVSSFTNQVFHLVDGHSALVRERTADAFAEAIITLLHDASLRQRLAKNATEKFLPFAEHAVADLWRRSLTTVQAELCGSHGPHVTTTDAPATGIADREHRDDDNTIPG